MKRIGIDARFIADFGIGTYVRGLLNGLASIEREEEYVVFAPPEHRARIPDAFEFVPVTVPRYSIRELFVMSLAIRRARIDLFHVPHFVVPFFAGPTVVTLHDAIPFRYPVPNPIAWPYIFVMTRRASVLARRVLTVSESARDDLVETLDVDEEKVAVTYNGIDELYFGDIEPSRNYGRYFLYVGNVGTHKNVGALLDAFTRLRRQERDVRLVLVGARHERHARVDGVTFPGFVTNEELASLYRGAVALVMPSFVEGFGLPAAEAMASGTAVITSTAAALVEVTGDAALHVDPRKPDDLAKAMAALLHDEALRATLAARGRKRARHFSWRACAEATREVYLQVLRE